MKKHWEIVEFTYGFAVVYKNKRVALCGTEEAAKVVVTSHGRRMPAARGRRAPVWSK